MSAGAGARGWVNAAQEGSEDLLLLDAVPEGEIVGPVPGRWQGGSGSLSTECLKIREVGGLSVRGMETR